MSTISASTTSTTAFKITTDTTGALVFQTGASPTTAMTLGSDQSVTFAGTPTYSGGTANGVAYLNGSKVLTTGTALVFDGTNLGVGVSSPSTYGKVAVNVGNILSFSTDQYSNVLIATGSTATNQAYGLNIQVGNPGSLGFSKGAGVNFYGNTQDNPTTTGFAGSAIISASTDTGITSTNGGQVILRTGASSSTRFAIGQSGQVMFGTSTVSNDRFIGANFAGVTVSGASQFGLVMNPTFTNNATNIYGLYSGLALTNTATNVYGVYVDGSTGGTITNRYGLYQAGSNDKNYFAGQVTMGAGRGGLNANSIISGNLVAGNIATNVNGVATWYLLAANENGSPGYMMMGSIMAGSYTAYSMVNLWVQKVYATTSVNGAITGLTRDGSFTIAIQRVTYGGGNYIALYISGSNPEIDVLWTGYQLNSVCTNNQFVALTSGVTVVSTVASY